MRIHTTTGVTYVRTHLSESKTSRRTRQERVTTSKCKMQKEKVTATAVKAAKLTKRTEIYVQDTDTLPKVRWGELEADNAWRFRYLDSIFEAGGGQMADVERRVTMTSQRFDQMRHIWTRKPLHIRLRL